MLLHGLPSSSERARSESWCTLYLVLQALIAKTIALNLTETCDVLAKILFRGTEPIRGNSGPPHVLHQFTTLLPNARGVSKAILNSDAVAIKAIFGASGGGKAAAGGGIRAAGASARTSSGEGRVQCVWWSVEYLSMLPLPGPLSVRNGRVYAVRAVCPAGGEQRIAVATPLAPVTSE